MNELRSETRQGVDGDNNNMTDNLVLYDAMTWNHCIDVPIQTPEYTDEQLTKIHFKFNQIFFHFKKWKSPKFIFVPLQEMKMTKIHIFSTSRNENELSPSIVLCATVTKILGPNLGQNHFQMEEGIDKYRNSNKNRSKKWRFVPGRKTQYNFNCCWLP